MNQYEHLNYLAEMVIDGVVTSKLDYIATIFINKWHYFNVFRRYNSPYNIVIEDRNNDIYLHQDYKVRSSLRTILCLSKKQSQEIYPLAATSFKHCGPVPNLTNDIVNMRWTEIHENYACLNIDFGGIFVGTDEIPVTPQQQINTENAVCPSAPRCFKDEEINAARVLLSISIPEEKDPFSVRECDGHSMSMRFADVQKRINNCDSSISTGCTRKRETVCHCEVDNSDYESSCDDYNYLKLRSGTMIPKNY